MANAAELLQQLGFSEYEARVYVALLQHNPLNGYALAKESGIPRANVYGVLQKLEERGAVFAVDTSSGTTYSPVLPDELMRRLGSRIGNVLETARHSLKQLEHPVKQTYVQNVEGYGQITEHAQDVIGLAQEQLLLALWQPEAAVLADELKQAEARGIVIQTLCFQACPEECDGCQGQIFRYHVTPPDSTHWLIIIRDDSDMLIGTTGTPAAAIRTQQTSLIEIASGYIRHSLTLAAVLSDLGGRLEGMLQPQTQALLRTIGNDVSWLEHMRRLIQH